MPESLLSPSQIKMFGRPFAGLQLVQPTRDQVEPNPVSASVSRSAPKTEQTVDLPLHDQTEADARPPTDQPDDDTKRDDVPPADAAYDLLANQLIKPDSTLARIYGFTYEGRFFDLPQPAIFLVHGQGRKVSPNLAGALDKSGVLARDWVFEEDARYWEYDRVNYSLRIDMATGTLDDILLAACEAAGGAGSSRSTMASRSTVASRSDLSSRSDMAARSDMNSRFRMG